MVRKDLGKKNCFKFCLKKKVKKIEIVLKGQKGFLEKRIRNY